jgi:hypothetical protein
MKKIILVGGAVMLLLAAGFQIAWSNDDEGDYEGKGSLFKKTPDVAPVQNKTYVDECASCHMAYPPGLLPARSWQTLMDGLSNHFGDNAELDPATTAELSRYLVQNSADSSNYRRSKKIMRSLDNKAKPLRISGLPYIQNKHDEIPQHFIKANKQVGSLSNCIACHQGAEQGSFSERDIQIPGYGRWDD